MYVPDHLGRGRRRGVRIGLSLALLGGLTGLAVNGTSASGASMASAAASARPCASDNYAPASRTVAPVRVTRSTGAVASPDAVLQGRSTTLTGVGSSVTVDFGEEVGGIVSLRFAGAGKGRQWLGLAFSESSQYIGADSDSSSGHGRDGAIYAAATPNTTWTMPTASLRGGFRYLTLFAATAGPISLDGVSLAISFAPDMTDLRAYDNYFCSSDLLLNRIWYAGAYTVETDTISPSTGRVWPPPAQGWNNGATVGVGTEVLTDGAKRDRTVWPGDLGISAPTEYASLGSLTPTRNALTTLYNYQAASGELPYAGPEMSSRSSSDTYHLWTLVDTADYYQYSHDKAWLDGVWSNYERALAYSLAEMGTDGLMTVHSPSDWARTGQGGENLEANALLYETLITGAQLAALENDTAHAASWTATAARVKNAINTRLWDETAGEYRDNPTSNLLPQDGNSLAVWYDVAPADRAARIDSALTKNWNSYGATTPEFKGYISTFPGSMELMAHLRAGDAARALALMRTEWGYMLDSPLGTGSTFWEGYLTSGKFGYGGGGLYMSNAHGWATGPTSALTFYVLGIRPTTLDGGYDLQPQTADLSNAEGSLSTPFGEITLAWTHDVHNGTFTEQITAPAPAVDKVEVPTYGANTRVTVNGQTVWDGTGPLAYGAHLENGYVVLTDTPTQASIVSQAIG